MFYLVLLIDIDILKVYIVFFFYIIIFTCIQCNFTYNLNIRVLVDCISCVNNLPYEGGGC